MPGYLVKQVLWLHVYPPMRYLLHFFIGWKSLSTVNLHSPKDHD